MDIQPIDERVSFGDQPEELEFKDLAHRKFKSVINLRRDGEENQPLSPESEGGAAGKAGLEYRHLPVFMPELRTEQLDRFRKEMEQLPGPVYVHCQGGTRAGILAMVHHAVQSGMNGAQALEEIDRRGIRCEAPELREKLRNYVDMHFEVGD